MVIFLPKSLRAIDHSIWEHQNQSSDFFTHSTTFFSSLIVRRAHASNKWKSQHMLMMLTDILSYITEEMQLSEETRRLLKNGCQVVSTSCSKGIVVKLEHLHVIKSRYKQVDHTQQVIKHPLTRIKLQAKAETHNEL